MKMPQIVHQTLYGEMIAHSDMKRKIYESRVFQAPNILGELSFTIQACTFSRYWNRTSMAPQMGIISGMMISCPKFVCLLFVCLKSMHGHRFHIKFLGGSQEPVKTKNETE